MPTLDQISLNALKARFESSHGDFKVSDYVEVSQNLTNYMFSICESKKQPHKVKFQAISLF